MTYEVSLIPLKLVELTWPDVEDYLKSAVLVTRGRDTWEQVYGRILSRRSQLWVALRLDGAENQKVIVGAVVTSVQMYGDKRVLRVDYCGGESLDKWMHDMLNTLESFARMEKATALEFVGRPGWARVLKPEGWSSCMVVMEKDISAEPGVNVAQM